MSSNDPPGARPGGAGNDDLGDAGTLVVEDPGFAIVGEWVITAEISDAAFRVYSMLLRFGNTSGTRMPSRALLGRRLRRSVDSIDRALRELQSTGLVRVEHRHDGRQYRSNRYHVRTSPPSPITRQDATVRVEEGGRRTAALPTPHDPDPTTTCRADTWRRLRDPSGGGPAGTVRHR